MGTWEKGRSQHLQREDKFQHSYLCETWQIDQSQVQDIWRVNLEIDRLAIDALVVSSYP